MNFVPICVYFNDSRGEKSVQCHDNATQSVQLPQREFSKMPEAPQESKMEFNFLNISLLKES